MNATVALLRANPGLLAMVVGLAIGTVVFAAFGITMARSGASLRPILFVAGMFALVLLPQLAYHLGVATGAISRRNLTWLPASTQASVYGWVERAWRDGTLVDAERFALPEAQEPAAAVPPSEPAAAVSPQAAAPPAVVEPRAVAELGAPAEPAATASPPAAALGRFAFGVDLQTGDVYLDSLRRRLAAAAYAALPQVRAGDFAAADAAVLAVDCEIQSSVMLGAMYTEELRAAVARGERESRPEFVAALYEHALRWRLSAYPEPHTAYEGDAFEAGRAADRAELAAVLAAAREEV